MASSVPQELTDIIIDHIHGDKPALFSSSLVCQDWLQSARYHLFYSISVDAAKPNDLLHYLEDTPSIRPLIRSLSLRGHKSATPDVVDADIIQALLKQLDSLHTLILDGVHWNPASLHDDGNIGPLQRRLRTLVLTKVTSQPDDTISTHAILNILHPFTYIQNLELSHIRFEPVLDFMPFLMDSPGGDSRRVEIENMSIHQTSFVKLFFDSLRRSRAVKSLLSLRVQAGGVADAYAFRSFLVDAAPTLRHLEFDLVDRRRPLFLSPDTVKRTFSPQLSACTSLHSLHIRILADHNHYGTPSPADAYGSGYPLLAAVLPDLPPSFQSLKITVTVPHATTEDRMMTLAAYLTAAEFQDGVQVVKGLMREEHLKDLTLDVVSEDEDDLHSEELRKMLKEELIKAF